MDRLAAITVALATIAAAACGAEPAVAIDAATGAGAIDGPAVVCDALDEASCLARDDCHAGYEVSPCRNILGYCAEFAACDPGQADCLGPASCEIVEPFCAGPYVNSYRGLCYGRCARADQCAGCRADKISFTQATGCANDGGVELCIPPVLQHALAMIAPTVTCAPGVGRARCDPASELLCQFPTDATTCAAPHGALTDDAWDTLCGITMLPDVTAIVPTFAE